MIPATEPVLVQQEPWPQLSLHWNLWRDSGWCYLSQAWSRQRHSPVPCSSPELWSLWAARVPWQGRKGQLLVLELAQVTATPPAPAAWSRAAPRPRSSLRTNSPCSKPPGTEPRSLPAPCQLHAGQTLHASFRSPRSAWQRGDSGDTHRSHPVTAAHARPCPNRGSTGAANPAQFTGHCPRAHPYALMQISLFSILSKA